MYVVHIRPPGYESRVGMLKRSREQRESRGKCAGAAASVQGLSLTSLA
jgi:hypothetical protein